MKKGILLRKSRIEGDQIKELLSTLLSELSDWNGAAHATVALRPVDSEDILDDEVDLEDSQSHFFDDIEDAHSSIIALKQTFESWTARFPTDYENCYGTLSLPGVFDIHVRMELLLWDPFHSKTDLEAYQWHSLLMNYGNEPEPLLITKLVTRCCFPLLTSYTDALQVTSLNHSKNLSYALNQLLDYVDSSSAPFQVFTHTS